MKGSRLLRCPTLSCLVMMRFCPTLEKSGLFRKNQRTLGGQGRNTCRKWSALNKRGRKASFECVFISRSPGAPVVMAKLGRSVCSMQLAVVEKVSHHTLLLDRCWGYITPFNLPLSHINWDLYRSRD